jgi:hypothetical protein
MGLAIADTGSLYFCVVIKCCRGVILLRPLAGQGDDHLIVFLYESKFLEFLSTDGSKAPESACEAD